MPGSGKRNLGFQWLLPGAGPPGTGRSPLSGEALRPGPQAVDSLPSPAPARSERAHGLDSRFFACDPWVPGPACDLLMTSSMEFAACVLGV